MDKVLSSLKSNQNFAFKINYLQTQSLFEKTPLRQGQLINQFIFGEITVEQYHQIEETKQKQTTGEKKIYSYNFYKQILCTQAQ